MFEELLDNYIRFLDSLTVGHFIRLFWFYIFFEFMRYFLLEFFVLNLWKLSGLWSKKKYAQAKKEFHFEYPLVSIIIPGKNEGKHLYKLVTSLNEQTYKNTEVIVVDDGSDDDTPIIGRALEKAGMLDVFIRNEVRGGKASGANTALRFTKGKYIVHLDADCSYDRDAIEKIIIPFYLDRDVAGVGGNVMVRNYDESLVTTLQAIEYYDTISIGRVVTSYLGIYRVISGAFGAFRADALDQVKGWDIGPGLDGDITVKLRKLGYKIKFEQEAVCLTTVPNTVKKLTRQRLRWDKSLIRFRVRKHKDVLFPNQAFSFLNFFAFLENITYNLLLNFKWYFYLGDMLTNYRSMLVNIIITNVLLYTATNFFKFVVYSLYRARTNASYTYFLIYIPCMVFYFGYYLRVVRTIAYIQEFFFKQSYKDPWNPAKTSIHAKKMNL
ncbi:MAG: biofilm PGA synthesis N-glycosyltransferase PgaC [Arenicella sp.]|jgi:biofilm PGA synthesis N-glycosyltransferase PgaC